MREKIKKWWKKYVTTRYAIRRAVTVKWFVYKDGKQKVKVSYGIFEVLCADKWLKQKWYQSKGAQPKLFKGYLAYRKLRKLQNKFKEQYKVELVKENNLPIAEGFTSTVTL